MKRQDFTGPQRRPKALDLPKKCRDRTRLRHRSFFSAAGVSRFAKKRVPPPKSCEAPREKALGYVCGIQVKRALVPAVFENKRGFANTAAAGLKLISEAPWETRSRAAWR